MIVFEKLRYQNFLSTGNVFTEIILNRSGSTLVVGENGAGKSTFIDALTFALYGKPFRNINKPQLMNSITNKNLLVELDFSIGKKKYMIRRGMKPNIFEIFLHDEMLNQDAGARDYQEFLEKNILKMNFKAYSQIVVLGSANYTPFMQMPTHHRRGVIEDFLDIQIFSIMNSILKDKITANRSAINDIEYKIDLCDQKIEMHSKHINTIRANTNGLIKQKNKKIKEHEAAIKKLTKDTDTLAKQVSKLNEKISDHEKVSNRKSKLVKMESALEDKVRALSREIQFFHDHDNCPTCKQGIDHDFKNETISKRENKTKEVRDALIKLETEINVASTRLADIAVLNNEITKLNASISEHNSQIGFYNRYISDLNDEIEELNDQANNIDSESKDTTKFQEELKTHKRDKEDLSKEKSVHELASHLLKDTGIKTKIIRQYIPIMNKLINKYLASMDLFVNFELDESFNETIKSRFRDNFSYASFSEGEKMRIDLSLMFTWRAIAKLRNSASTNLLIMDEVFDSSLDAAGTEEFLKILESLTGDSNVFIISHKGDQLFDKFHSIIKFEKHANFSRIATQ